MVLYAVDHGAPNRSPLAPSNKDFKGGAPRSVVSEKFGSVLALSGAAMTSDIDNEAPEVWGGGYYDIQIFTDYTTLIEESPPLAANWSSWFNQYGTDCSDATALFSRRMFFMNCFVYPRISRDISLGNFTANLSVGLIPKTTLAQNITGTISACVQGLCGTLSDCNEINECSPTVLMINDTTLSAQAISDCWLEVCQRQATTVNPDIAGIGVRVFLQFCIYHIA